MGATFDVLFAMVVQSRIFVTAGDLEIDISGAAVEVDARLIQMRHDDTSVSYTHLTLPTTLVV